MNVDILKLQDNPVTRIPVCIVADTSSSMNKENRIGELRNGLATIIEDMTEDEMLAYSVEMCIVGFHFDNRKRRTSAKLMTEFSEIEDIVLPDIRAFGKTPLGEAVELGLNKLEERKDIYKDAGVQYYQPMLIILTDGDPTDSIENASRETKKQIRENKLSVYPVGIGDDFAMTELQKFVYKPLAKRIGVEDLSKLFQWIVSSASKVTNSGFDVSATSEIEKDWDELLGG